MKKKCLSKEYESFSERFKNSGFRKEKKIVHGVKFHPELFH